MDETEMVSRLRESTSASLSDTKARMLLETNPLAAWAQEWLIAASEDTKTYVGLAKPLERGHGFEDEAILLYPNYRGYMQRANFKEVSLTRFSALLEDLCRDQLRMAHVGKHRDKDGVYLTGIKLRTHRDRDISGFVDIAIAASRTVQDPVDSMKGSTPENADDVDYVNLSINDQPQLPGASAHILEFPQKSTYPTSSALSGAGAFIQPAPPYTVRSDATTEPLKPRRKRDEWPYGKRQLS
jgi:putative DNA primase/helicase